MAIITCPECGKDVSDKAAACPHCGAPITTTVNDRKPSKEEHSSSPILWIALGLVFLAFMFGTSIYKETPEDKQKARERAAIKLCWEEQARKSLDPATARFVASTCEMMEGKFKEKYRVNP